MLTFWTLLILANFCFAFVLLYPFYLRDRYPSRYRGLWMKIGEFLSDRHGSVWLIIILAGGTLFEITSQFIRNVFAYFLLLVIYFIFGTLLLLYPYHLKYRFPERYVGIWKSIGDWMGEPMVFLILPKKKD